MSAPQRLLLLGLLALGPHPLFAQRAVTGFVRDSATAAPLSGVYVALEEAESGEAVAKSLTDDTGRFVLVGRGGDRYRVRAERVGLATALSEAFSLSVRTAPLRIAMTERAVRLRGLDVRTAARTCDLPSAEAVVVQRWWDEIRKALQVTAVLEASQGIGLRFQRFERDLSAELEMIGPERIAASDTAFTSRPFPAQEAGTLAERGFVQGEPGERWFLAPDAAVLFSEVFLSRHCLGIADPERTEPWTGRGELLLSVRPTDRGPPDIRGVLTVDTISGELQSFDYRYVNLPEDLPASEAGGHLAFRYLPSGAWIVSDWWIRMPRVGRVKLADNAELHLSQLAGYLEQGGRVVEIGGESVDLDARVGSGVLHGTVYDSLSQGVLPGARVSIVGTRLVTRSDDEGRFVLEGVPAGTSRLAVHHQSWAVAGLPSPTREVRLDEGATDTVFVSSPGLATVSLFLCGGPAETVLAGVVSESPGQVRASWTSEDPESGSARSIHMDGEVAPDGHYLQCGLPAGIPLELAVRGDEAEPWMAAGTVELEEGRFTALDLRPRGEAAAVVRGAVRSAPDSTALPGASVAVMGILGDTVGRSVTDAVGRFEIRVPGDVGYRLMARAGNHWPEASGAFTLKGAESLDVVFDLAPRPPGPEFSIEGLLVEVETARAEAERRRAASFGLDPDAMGERWIGRDALDSLSVLHGDPGVAITMAAVPGVRVIDAAKYGQDPHLCVVAQRPNGPCAMILLNGVRIDLRTALHLDFRELESIAVISSRDAATLFGTVAGGGAVLLWTREGPR